ncbi:MAG: HDIG domain-containing metalloprotein [Planctomycetota bacterium]
MSTGNQTRTRSQRVAALELPPGRFSAVMKQARRGVVLLRIGLCLATSLCLWALTQGWNPPRDFRTDRVPTRPLIARSSFTLPDEDATEEARRLARSSAVAVYEKNPAELLQLQAKLLSEVNQLVGAAAFEEVDPERWRAFSPVLAEGTPAATAQEQAEQFARFKAALTAEGAAEQFKQSLDEVFAPLLRTGTLDKAPVDLGANVERIEVRAAGSTEFGLVTPVAGVLLENVTSALQRGLQQKAPSIEVADRVFAWLRPRLPVTLRLDAEATRRSQQAAEDAVEPQLKLYEPGDELADAGDPIDESEGILLELEYQKELESRTFEQKAARSLAVLGMYLALFMVGGFFAYRLDPHLLTDLPRLVTLLLTIIAAVAAMLLTHPYHRMVEVIPLLLFGMTLAIASGQELALLLSAAITLVGVVAVGHDLSDAVVLLAAATGAIVVLDAVRTRSKLLIVGFIAAGVAFLTAVGVYTLAGQPIGPTLERGLMLAVWAVIAGSLMMSALPLVEWLFGVQTDQRLLELGDPAHPVLQELIRRAPGTYNHSITVASLAEAATEAIGGRSLLVRVGAYYHDIGKMLHPQYFIENQGQGANRHDTLAPAMSTLVIIAHVKDGADLARQRKLPECIIDFIQQHHGTTLVEYFYRQASVRRGSDPDAAEVDESSFRYPGPKPQSKEAGVLMLADAVESASRVLVEPTPSRIENLVDELSKKRLADGQFDECGLTLQEVRKIGDSLIKSLAAVYHGRVKYPDQETA